MTSVVGLAGWEIHGFRSMKDLDIDSVLEEAKSRWLRPNEIHAILCNYKYFTIHAKPVTLPESGRIVLFDRKVLRNFRKDGHNWKKKNDGKTVKEAHEHLKVGNDERIHVYYAHGEDNPTFVRRCYWLLDKTMEQIVLVHYRETREGSPVTSTNSISSSGLSDPTASWNLSDVNGSPAEQAYCSVNRKLIVPGDCVTLGNYESKLHEINTLDWEELLVPDDPQKPIIPDVGQSPYFPQQDLFASNQSTPNSSIASTNMVPIENSFNGSQHLTGGMNNSLGVVPNDGLQTQDSFGRWINNIMTDSPEAVNNHWLESSIQSDLNSLISPASEILQSSISGQIFTITDVSPAWAFSDEDTKILVTGLFHEGYSSMAKSSLYCVCGDAYGPVEIVQPGVFRCLISPNNPGLVNLYLSIDSCKPISQVMTFEYRAPMIHNQISFTQEKWEEFQVQTRLFHLLFSTTKGLNILTSKVQKTYLKEAKFFARKASHIAEEWGSVIKSVGSTHIAYQHVKDSVLELTLKNKVYEWLMERIVDGHKISNHDENGQGVLHLCAILGYTWAVHAFSWSGFSLDYRDKFGWTALHWAAYYGRVEMVAKLLSAGAKPSLVTDPTPEVPGGCIAADLASQGGHDGLAAYLAEKGLVQHFKDMTLAGNASGSLETANIDSGNLQNLTEEELFLKDTLAAYRTAADAAGRIQSAFREHSLKLRTEAVESASPEEEARNIIAAMKIQHAFRNFETRKKVAAAARIQHRFRTWKLRQDFLNMRRQAIKIQAMFRRFQARRQYQKLVWSVGVLEKAILRWRLRRKGFRGLQVIPEEPENKKKESVAEEDFFQASRKQAVERVERSVIRVQALFRSKKAQEEYRIMKLTHDNAILQSVLDSSSNTEDME
ncbi:calmodulin-binding transcription activator 5 [Impatiens glandulifera]|uniref:calmodulin-binding transcription activator 5 n=1 Tax=Impatiens glandulifera TaxID=253017 RepID=UPI001FB11D7E|nr:calmodulin-binding transcription activator 5 [Impatiens glandulifera]